MNDERLTLSRTPPELPYTNFYRIAGHYICYIPLINSWRDGVHEYSVSQIVIQAEDRDFHLPTVFQSFSRAEKSEGRKCRLTRYEIEPNDGINAARLSLFLERTSYGDYLASGERLDEQLPGQTDKTFRDKFAPVLSALTNFNSLPLTNICGVGVFLITSDEKIIISRHAGNVLVYPNVWTYSSSGSMDWGDIPHPFSEIRRECMEEIGYDINPDNLCLFGLGIDAKKLYFQFSLFEHSRLTADDIIGKASLAKDYKNEIETLTALPFTAERIVEILKNEPWEPAAAASLLTLCAKKFGVDSVANVIDPEFLKAGWKRDLQSLWNERAKRPGVVAVMSSRVPERVRDQESRNYISAVFDFLDGDVDGRDVLEVGCGIGRMTEQLVQRASKVTCLELDPEMIRRCRERLGHFASVVTFNQTLVQEYRPAGKHDVVIVSQVLIHQVYEALYRKAVDVISASANEIFILDHVDVSAVASVDTRIRSEQELIVAFPDFRVERRGEHRLYEDNIVFIKLARRL